MFFFTLILTASAPLALGYVQIGGGNTGGGGGSVIIISSSNFTNFTQLLDAPSSYSGAAGKVVTVNAGETALEFTTISGSDNASWNQSFANTKYASIIWSYNQTTAAITDINSRFWNRTQTYNSTEIDTLIAGASGGNASWNQSFANTLYASIVWGYNQTTGAINDINARFWNRTQSYNTTQVDALIAGVTSNTSFNQTLTDALYLGWANQSYNDTVRINSVNTSANIKALGFINSSDSDVKYLNLSGTNANQNINILGFNFTNTGTGFFTFIGSSAARITTGWFTNVDTTNASVSGFLKLNATGSQANFNGSCSVFTGPTSTLSIC